MWIIAPNFALEDQSTRNAGHRRIPVSNHSVGILPVDNVQASSDFTVYIPGMAVAGEDDRSFFQKQGR